MSSFCNLPTFFFTISLPFPIPGFPALPSFTISLSFTLPACPLD